MSEINFFIINKDNDGRRLDNYLFSHFKKGIPKSKIYSSVRKAKIKVNGKKAKPDQKIKEGDKERIQFFKGDVLQRRGSGATETFTIRKISNGIAVERIFPVNSPSIDKIEINKIGKVRRARIFYLRDLTGKKARIKELKKK